MLNGAAQQSEGVFSQHKLNLINGIVTRLSDPTMQTLKYIVNSHRRARFSGLMFTSLHVLTSVCLYV